MNTTVVNKNQKNPDNQILSSFELQKLYAERMERFMALVELSYALKHSPKIIKKK